MQDIRLSEIIAFKEQVETLQQLFRCRRCGRCCTEFKGLKLSPTDMERLGFKQSDWPSCFTKLGEEYVLEQPCRYYDTEKKQCNVYEKRPDICRKYPVNTKLLDDGRRHLGVSRKCQAAVTALECLEMELLGHASYFD